MSEGRASQEKDCRLPFELEIDDPVVRQTWTRASSSGISEIVNGYVLALALQAFVSSGLMKKLREGPVTFNSVADVGGEVKVLDGLLQYLEIEGITQQTGEFWEITERGLALLDDVPRALLGYYTEAYGPVLSRMAGQLTGQEKYGKAVYRDAEALGRHCEILFRSFGTRLVEQLARRLNATGILDLGCGTGGLVIDLCRSIPNLRGYGMDIAPEAIAYARSRAELAGLSDRVTFMVKDAFKPWDWPEEVLARCNFLTAAGALHEHFRDGEDAVIDLLRRYQDVLRANNGTFLLCEPELHIDESDANFYLVHVMTAQGFPRPRKGWLPIIERAGLHCRRVTSHPGAGFKFAYYELSA